MRRKSDRKQAIKVNRQVLAQVAKIDEEARVARRAPPPPATPQLRKQPPRQSNREGLDASHAPTVSIPSVAGESQSAKETTGPL